MSEVAVRTPAAAPAAGPAAAVAAGTPRGPFDPPALRSGQTARGGLVAVAGQVVRAVVRLVGVAALGRLLAPEEFGLVAMVTVVSGFVGMFTDVGLSAATIQSPELTRPQVSALFWLNAALGAALAAGTAACAPLVAWFYGEPRLTALTAAMAVSFLMAGLTVQHQAVLRRRLRFTAVAAIAAVAQGGATVAAIAAAWAGWGPWALVVLALGNSAGLLVGCWSAGFWLPGRPARADGLRDLLTFGGAVTGFSVAEFGQRNVDKLLLGWWWGAGPLGLYGRAYALLMLPVQQTTWPLGSVAVASLSRVQHDAAAFRREFLSVYRLAVLMAAPLSGLCAVLGEEIVLIALGPGWDGAVRIFQVLALCAAGQPVLDSVRWIYVGLGRGAAQLWWGVGMFAVVAAGTAAGLPFGPVGVAAGYVAAVGFLIVPGVLACTRGTRIQPREFFTAAGPEWAAGLLAAAAAWPATQLDAPAAVRFAVGTGLGGGAAAAALLATGRLTAAIEFFTVRLRGRRPAPGASPGAGG